MSFQGSSPPASASISDRWIQDTALAIKLPALSPAVCNVLLSLVECQVKKISQQAHKFQRRAKESSLSVHDINLALRLNKIETVYGLSEAPDAVIANTNGEASQVTSLISLATYPKNPMLLCPLKPDITLHWLAVNGHQPLIPENPSAIVVENDDRQPTALPQELLQLYSRIAGAILASESSPALSAVFEVLRTDSSIQELIPYFCRFFYQQIKANTRRLVLLTTIIKCIQSLIANPNVNFQHHLHQVLPAIFTCVIAPKLCMTHTEDHWSLRRLAASTISSLCNQYSELVPLLFARICKTFSDALEADKALSTLYGGIVGLACMGHGATRSLLLPQLGDIEKRVSTELTSVSASLGTSTNAVDMISGDMFVTKKPRLSNDSHTTSQSATGEMMSMPIGSDQPAASEISESSNKKRLVENGCENIRLAVLDALGKYIVHSVRFSSSIGASPMSKTSRKNPSLLNLEEALIPYYASVSSEDYYSRLFI